MDQVQVFKWLLNKCYRTKECSHERYKKQKNQTYFTPLFFHHVCWRIRIWNIAVINLLFLWLVMSFFAFSVFWQFYYLWFLIGSNCTVLDQLCCRIQWQRHQGLCNILRNSGIPEPNPHVHTRKWKHKSPALPVQTMIHRSRPLEKYLRLLLWHACHNHFPLNHEDTLHDSHSSHLLYSLHLAHWRCC